MVAINNMARFIITASLLRGRDSSRPRLKLTNATTLASATYRAHHAIAVFLTTFFANFRELWFYDVRCKAGQGGRASLVGLPRRYRRRTSFHLGGFVRINAPSVPLYRSLPHARACLQP